MDWITHLSASHWMVLGLALLAVEVVAGIGYLLGPGLAALLLALLSWLLPLSPNVQLLSFAIGSIAATYAYVRYFRRKPGETDSATGLHNRTASMVGRETLLKEDISGNARIAFGDTLWRVKTHQALTQGTTVVVTAIENDILIIERLEQPPAT